MKEEEPKDEKGLPPLTDEEEQAVRSANEVNNIVPSDFATQMCISRSDSYPR